MTDRNVVKVYGTISQVGAGTSSWLTLDHAPTDHNYVLICTTSGTVDYDVEIAAEDTSGSPNAIQHDKIQGKTADFASTWNWPAQGFRILVNSGAGTVNLIVVEGDS